MWLQSDILLYLFKNLFSLGEVYLYDLDHYQDVMFFFRECPKMVSMRKKLAYIWLA